MWDLKLQSIENFLLFNTLFTALLFDTTDMLDPTIYNGFWLFNWKIYYQFAQNMTFFFALKFLLSIGFLILIRGGTPRYRYDYLTKLGWLKFLGFVILAFFFSLLIIFIF